MSIDIVRAWRDETYCMSLTEEQRATLENPAGPIELLDADLDGAGGLQPAECTNPVSACTCPTKSIQCLECC